MSNRELKIKMPTDQLIDYMKNEQGITFNHISEAEALDYITHVNNYFRTAAYRKNYKKHNCGPNFGKYIDLDFAYLKELSVLEMRFRDIVANMTIDVEHALKVKLITDIERDRRTDGYDIIEEFIGKNRYILSKLEMNGDSSFTEDLFRKYFREEDYKNPKTGKKGTRIVVYNDCPAWVFVELINFSDLIRLCDFYYRSRDYWHVGTDILNIVKDFRNATAHNNCMFENFNHRAKNVPEVLLEFVADIPGSERLATRPMLEFVTLLYAYEKLVSDEVKEYRIMQLKWLFCERMLEHKEYFENNELIKETYRFAHLVVDKYYGGHSYERTGF